MKKTTPLTKFRMIPTQNMTHDRDFRYVSDAPTVVNFIMTLGESTETIDMDAFKKFTNRNVLSISSCWSE